MFIASTKAYEARRADGASFFIPRGFVGEIPDWVAESLIVQLALKDGSITTPATKKDKAIDEAVEESKAKNLADQKAKEEKEEAKETKKKK